MDEFLSTESPPLREIAADLRVDPYPSRQELRRLVPHYMVRTLLTNPQAIPEAYWAMRVRLRLTELAFLETELQNIACGWAGAGLVEHRHRQNRLATLLLLCLDFYRRAPHGAGRSEEATVGIRALFGHIETLMIALRADGLIFR